MRSLEFGSRAWVLALVLSLTAIGGAEARQIQGALAMTDGFEIVLEVKEGTISEMLRFMHVKGAPREQVSLSKLGSAGDRIFVGTDYCLYCQKKTGNGPSDAEIYKIGRAHKLWDIRLFDGVRMVEVESALGAFTGEGNVKSLKVDVGKAEKKGSDVEPATMKFWLDEVVYQYDSPGSRKGKQDNFQIISRSIVGALPSRDDDHQERLNNIKVLRSFIKEAKDSDLVPFRDLLGRKIQALAEERASSASDSEKYEPLVKEYESLKAEVVKRTEGF